MIEILRGGGLERMAARGERLREGLALALVLARRITATETLVTQPIPSLG